MKKRVFISFDYDHDSDIKGSLVAQSRLADAVYLRCRTASRDVSGLHY